MSDIWLTSEGLDVHFDDNAEEIVKVKYGQLEGSFVSLESCNNRLEFQTSNLDLAFRYFEQRPSSAMISFGEFSYQIKWDVHNYKVRKFTDNTVVITIEELQ